MDNGREGRRKIQEEREECYEEEEKEIIREEIIEQLRKLEKEKALGENGIENEAWKLIPKEVEKVLFKLLNKIWKERGIAEDWTKGIINPLYKKGDKKETKNYKGITLVDTAYKIYASILNER